MANPYLDSSEITADFFLDWSLLNWETIYKNQKNILKLNLPNYQISLPQVLCFDNSVENLTIEQIYFKFNEQKFILSPELDNLQLFNLYQQFISRQNRLLFNSSCLRLQSLNYVNTPEKKLLLEVQETDYFSYLKTNLMLDVKNSSDFSLREKLHIQNNDHQIEKLANSSLANILGINILLVTQDLKLILQQRSSTTLIRPNQLCSSGSGTITKEDLSNLETISPQAICRELSEEIGLNILEIVKDKTVFLGITRELIRGGIPETFWLTYIDVTSQEIAKIYKSRKDTSESKNLLLLPLFPFQSFTDFIKKYHSLISQPLWAHLALLSKILSSI